MSDRDPRAQQPPSAQDNDNVGGTDTQPRPNISTEHQREGDARDPGDTLDKDRVDERADTPGSLDQENVDDRPNVSTVTPDDYPHQQ